MKQVWDRAKLKARCVVSLVFALSILVAPLTAMAAPHVPGSVVKTSDGTIWFITNSNQRRAFSSAGAFQSYGFLSFGQVVDASSEDLALEQGPLIPPQDGKIFCATETKGSDVKGECSLITNGQKAAFTSAAVFTGLGFSFNNALSGDSSFLSKTANISFASEAHRPGVLINKSGTILLVGQSALLGIPSMDVFYSWGYSLADVVLANGSDNGLQQYGIMQARVPGQLSPTTYEAPGGGVSTDEGAVLREYLDAYPAIPTGTISSQVDVDAILELGNQIPSDAKLAEVLPYMTAKSVEMLNKMPSYKLDFDAANYQLYESEITDVDVTIYSGGLLARADIHEEQGSTGYESTTSLMFAKENGTWKLDIIGSIVLEAARIDDENPGDAAVTGRGDTDLAIRAMSYATEPVRINDTEAMFLAHIENEGDTTIEHFSLGLDINGSEVYYDEIRYRLEPGDEYVLAIPIDKYWALPSVNKAPGTYRTDLYVYAGSEQDENPDDNSYSDETEFAY